MKKQTIKRIITIGLSLMFMLSIISAPVSSNNNNIVKGAVTLTTAKLKTVKKLHVTRKSDRSIKLNWKKSAGADGYIIYRQNKKTKKYKKIKTIKNAKTTSWVNKKLPKNKVQRYKIKSYKTVEGNRIYSKFSYYVGAKTFTKKSKVVNVEKVTINNRNTVRLGFHNKTSGKLKAKVSAGKNKKALSKKIRWFSTNPKVARVKNGKIIAGSKAGICSIYAKAHNGKNSKMKKVRVIDYALSADFEYTKSAPVEVRHVLNNYSKEVKEIGSFFCKNANKYKNINQETYIYLDENDKVVVENDIKLSLKPIMKQIEKLLKESDYQMAIGAGKLGLSIYIFPSEYTDVYITYTYTDTFSSSFTELCYRWDYYKEIIRDI